MSGQRYNINSDQYKNKCSLGYVRSDQVKLDYVHNQRAKNLTKCFLSIPLKLGQVKKIMASDKSLNFSVIYLVLARYGTTFMFENLIVCYPESTYKLDSMSRLKIRIR